MRPTLFLGLCHFTGTPSPSILSARNAWPLTPMWSEAQHPVICSITLVTGSVIAAWAVNSANMCTDKPHLQESSGHYFTVCRPWGSECTFWHCVIACSLEDIWKLWGSGRNCRLVTSSRQQKVVFFLLFRLWLLPRQNVRYFWKISE